MLNQHQRDMLGGRGGTMPGREDLGQLGKDGRLSGDQRTQQAALNSRAAAFMRSVQHALHDDPDQQDAQANQQAATMMVLASSTNLPAATVDGPVAGTGSLPAALQDIVSQIQIVVEKQAIRPIGAVVSNRFEMQLTLASTPGADLHGIRVSVADGELDVILIHGGEVPSLALSEAARTLVEALRLRYPQRVVRVIGQRDDGASADVVQDGLSAISQLLSAPRKST